jgi:hypothetical protein
MPRHVRHDKPVTSASHPAGKVFDEEPQCAIVSRQHGFLAMRQQQRFVQSTQWLRPVTRWATRFSLNAPQWLPAPVRHAPLRLTSLVLKAYHRVLR